MLYAKQIEQLIKIREPRCPGSFENEIFCKFTNSELWLNSEFKKNRDPCSLLELRAVLSEGYTIRQLSKQVDCLWIGLAYSNFQISSTILYKEALLFRFATAPENEFCITGKIIISGQFYEIEAKKFECERNLILKSIISVPDSDIEK